MHNCNRILSKWLSTLTLIIAVVALSSCVEDKAKFAEGSKISAPSPLSSLKSKRSIPPQIAYAFNLLKQGEYQEASSFINQSLQSYPQYIGLHILNGLTYEKLAEIGDASLLELAAVGYQNALNLDPNNYFALMQLGKLRYRQKHFDQAQEHFANALLIKPNDPTLLQELAAASYYAYDLKTALHSINKAKNIKPKDPLIQRSAAMIYAAVGDFSASKLHLAQFKAYAGNDPDVNRVESRIQDWNSLYDSGRIDMVSDTLPTFGKLNAPSKSPAGKPSSNTPPPPPAPSPRLPPLNTPADGQDAMDAGAESGEAGTNPFPPLGNPGDSSDVLGMGDALQVNDEAGQVLGSGPHNAGPGAASHAHKSPHGPQIIVDCYMLRITEDATTSKGNNILEHLSVTLNPGTVSWFKGRAGGNLFPTGAGSQPSSSDSTSSLSVKTDTGFRAFSENKDDARANFTPSENAFNFATTGSLSSTTFASGLTWAGLTYSLNIANAVDKRTEVVGRPSLLTFIGKQSVFFSGSELVNGFAGQLGSSLLKYPVGVTLVVTPISMDNDVITFDISLEGSLLTDPNPDLQQTVNVGKTRVDTSAKVRLGETLMLGGIYQRIEELSKKGMPGLQDVPIVQYFFSKEQTLSQRQSIVFMLTPRSPDAVKLAVNRAMAREESQPKLTEYINRNPDWYNSHPNFVQIFKYLTVDPIIYYEFRNGDILPPHWGWDGTLDEHLTQVSEFIYY